MENFILFKTFVKQQKKNFNERSYEDDIQYRAKIFRQYSLKYRRYVEEHKLANDYILLAHEVSEYERRLKNYRES